MVQCRDKEKLQEVLVGLFLYLSYSGQMINIKRIPEQAPAQIQSASGSIPSSAVAKAKHLEATAYNLTSPEKVEKFANNPAS